MKDHTLDNKNMTDFTLLFLTRVVPSEVTNKSAPRANRFRPPTTRVSTLKKLKISNTTLE